MIPYVILAPELDRAHDRILRAMLGQARLPLAPVIETWAEVVKLEAGARVVASFGKTALDQWHDYGLIRVGNQHGNMFRHATPSTRLVHDIMVLHHPGTLLQQSMAGYGAKGEMRRDLTELLNLLAGTVRPEDLRMPRCAKCQNARVKGGGGKSIPAQHWPEEIDTVGLCEVHYNKRGQIRGKSTIKKRVNPTSHAAQIEGQMSMWAPKR